jgi:DNA-binding NarL/FixJ family response regulator
MMTLVLVADDQTVVQTIRVALRHAPSLRVVATVDGRSSARVALSKHRPDVVLVDEMCQIANGLARVREARESAPDATVVLHSDGLQPGAVKLAMEAGAHAVVSRHLHAATLGTLVREIVEGNVVHAPQSVRPRGVDEAPQSSRLASVYAPPDQAPAARTSA